MDAVGRSSVWTIDRENVITSVGGDWDAFAESNDAASLCGSSVVGRSLFDFISGEETQRIYRLLLRRCARWTRRSSCPSAATRQKCGVTCVSRSNR